MKQIINDMRNCYQFKDLSVLGHGLAVKRKASKLVKGDFQGFTLPDWFKDNFTQISECIYDWKVVKRYAIWHDCGKPYCRTVDPEGKQHFDGHAEQSKRTFLEKVSQNNVVADLIGNDMLLHTCKADELEICLKSGKLNKPDAFTLLIVAFAELHANAEMFGGTDSVSFKIKYKQLDKRGKQILAYFK